MSNNYEKDNNADYSDIWFSQAMFDLKAAKDSMENENYEWSCFQAQQAAEKALKSFLYANRKRNIFTHSIKKLIEIASEINETIAPLKEARILDQYYIPTRYPNGLPGDIPHNYYIKKDAEKCVKFAQKIISQIGKILEKS
ncbi:MAG: HEPN domain-containing protein [Promethearchaeia archaeon]